MSETLSGGTVSLPVKPDTRGFGQSMQSGIMGESSGLGGLGMKLGGILLGGIAAAGIGQKIGEFIGTGIREYSDADAAIAQLNAGMISTGNVANLNVKSMTDLASSIQAYSGQTDDSIMKTEQILQTFTNIRNVGPDKIFDDTTKAAANMAAKLGGDASSQAIQLGKALNDPVKGMTALRRVGVSFSQQQTDQVKAMVAAGNVMGAQKVILGELSTEFGGAAEAAGKTFPGMLARLKRSFEDLSQSVMGAFIPAVMPALTGIVDLMQKVQESSGFKNLIDHLSQFARGESDKLKGFFDSVLSVFNSGSKNPLSDLATQLAKANPVLGLLLTIASALQPILPQVFDAFSTIAPQLIPVIPVLAKVVVELMPALLQIVLALMPLLPPLAQLLVAVAPPVAAIAMALGQVIAAQTGIDLFFVGLITNLTQGKTSIGDFIGLFQNVPDSLKGMLKGVSDFIFGIVNSSIDAMNGLMAIIPGFVNMISDALGIGVHVGHIQIPHVFNSLNLDTSTQGPSRGNNLIKTAANGGTFAPQPGGQLVNLAEAGRAETVVDTATLQAAMAQRRGPTIQFGDIYQQPGTTITETMQAAGFLAGQIA